MYTLFLIIIILNFGLVKKQSTYPFGIFITPSSIRDIGHASTIVKIRASITVVGIPAKERENVDYLIHY